MLFFFVFELVAGFNIVAAFPGKRRNFRLDFYFKMSNAR